MHVTKNDENYFIQHYKPDHENEYTLISEKEIRHYENGLLCGLWKLQDGKICGDFEVFEEGCALFRQDWSSLGNKYWVRTVNEEMGYVKEIVDSKTKKVIYRGDLDKDGKRRGRGFMFDSQSGELVLEGFWTNDSLRKIIRLFEGEKMTEFKENGDNMDAFQRHPVYVGGYKYNKSSNICFRHGRGYTINSEGIASSEGRWEKGIEVESMYLINGWYRVEENPLSISTETTTIYIPAYEFQYNDFLNLNQYKKVIEIRIEEYNFCNANRFKLDEIDTLEELEIGRNCFFNSNISNQLNYTFSITDCCNLRSIIIGSFSFKLFGSEFRLSNLPSLEILKIGVIGDSSANFIRSNFVVKRKRVCFCLICRFGKVENH